MDRPNQPNHGELSQKREVCLSTGYHTTRHTKEMSIGLLTTLVGKPGGIQDNSKSIMSVRICNRKTVTCDHRVHLKAVHNQ